MPEGFPPVFSIIWPILKNVPVCYNMPAYMPNIPKNEVEIIRKVIVFISLFLLALGVLARPVKVHAATLDSQAGVVSTTSTGLNVRSGASTSNGILAELRKGSYVTLLSQSGSWWRVEYGQGRYGYCHGDYITPVSGTVARVATQSTGLNVRSGAGTSYSRVGYLEKGETVIVLSGSNGWSRILYHGSKTGYASSQYLSSNTGNVGNTGAIRLNVPDFKQTDSRWANVTLGSSGQTMARIGCATTAVAMMESYRTGTTIYPNAMAKQLRYTSSGALYWPSNLVPVTNLHGYLSEVNRLLHEGKPVLFGAKNSYGKQHWVVIYGVSGGDAGSASQYLVRDPGSNSRTTLQQFLNAYPVAYKYFYHR